jgi:hypothetical protein
MAIYKDTGVPCVNKNRQKKRSFISDAYRALGEIVD